MTVGFTVESGSQAAINRAPVKCLEPWKQIALIALSNGHKLILADCNLAVVKLPDPERPASS